MHDDREELEILEVLWEDGKSDPPFPDGPLPQGGKWELECHSVSLEAGHAASEIYYDPESRQAVLETWMATDDFEDPATGQMRCVTRERKECQPIPGHITTTWALWEYLQKKQPGWYLGME